MMIPAGTPQDLKPAGNEHWLMLFDRVAAAEAARLGSTESRVFVNQVKFGMSFGEIERALAFRKCVDLSEKVCITIKT